MTRSASAARSAPMDDDRLSLRLWLQLIKASKAIEGDIGTRFRRTYGQSLARFDVLSQLYRSEDGWTAIGILGDRLMTGSGNITALIDRMAAEGLVERRPSPTDRRSHQVRMTENGAALFHAMTDDHAAWVDEALADVNEKDKKALIGLLVRVRRAFEDRRPGDLRGDDRPASREKTE